MKVLKLKNLNSSNVVQITDMKFKEAKIIPYFNLVFLVLIL